MATSSSSTSRRSILAGLIILVGLIIGAAYSFKWLWDVFTSLEKEVAAAIIVTSGTVLVSVFSVILTRTYERQGEIQREFRAKKVEIYQNLVGLFFTILYNSRRKKHDQLSEQDLVEVYRKTTQDLTVWGTDEVIVKWSRFRTLSAKPQDSSPLEILREFESILLAIRKDLGHENKGIEPGTILGLFINDVQNLDLDN